METFLIILPYIITILCSLITGFTAYFCAAKNGKNEINKLREQQRADMKFQKQAFDSEIEKMALQHKYELEKMSMQKSSAMEDTLVKSILTDPNAIANLTSVARMVPTFVKVKDEVEKATKDKTQREE